MKAAGGTVRKGERGVPVVFWKVYNYEDTETGEAEAFRPTAVYVFNAVQLDGVTIPEITVLAHRFTPIERCAHLVNAMPQCPAILHGHQRAFTRPPPIRCICRSSHAFRARKRITRRCFTNWCTPQGIRRDSTAAP